MAAPHLAPEPATARRTAAALAPVLLVYAATVAPAFLLGPWWGLAAVAALLAAAAVLCRTMDRWVLWAAGARPVGADEEPELHAVVERLCLSSGLPKPRVAVSAAREPNAFAAGSGPGSAVVCVTEGLRERLGPAELAAVLGHEMAHVAGRDVLAGCVAAFPTLCAGLVLDGWALLWRGGPLGALAAVLLAPLAAVAALLYGAGTLAAMALSRRRELRADEAGTLLTGRPGDLAEALAKISARPGGKAGAGPGAGPAGRRTLRPVSTLCVVPAALTASHPPVADRRARLLTVARRLAAGA
ncbi:M48 family metalloprotease [Actinomadura parmotrematis]|uniref:M48 family metalloprotease n=1 Tax=Actinomadura parmotrematis TaxID=2864039 RepID=A0ABS7FKD7_9ACTN|nr:M48 family metalloprotease [Actinomadura parmotrematis]MBW8480829.1 M48 family metalloprotease [Actinomadura parmotrematis]